MGRARFDNQLRCDGDVRRPRFQSETDFGAAITSIALTGFVFVFEQVLR